MEIPMSGKNKHIQEIEKKYLKELYKNEDAKSLIDKEKKKKLVDWQITLLNNLK